MFTEPSQQDELQELTDKLATLPVRRVVVLLDDMDRMQGSELRVLHTAKRSPANGLLGDPVKPDLYLVQPGSISRSEVYVESRPCSEPALDSRMLVGRVVVYDHMVCLAKTLSVREINSLHNPSIP